MDQNTMKVFYDDGEIENFEVNFEAFDIESLMVPMVGALVFRGNNNQVCIMLDKVKKLEFTFKEE